MITTDDLKKFGPHAKAEYIAALLGGTEIMRDAGIFETPARMAHFMAQIGHETGGLTIIRENLHYTSPERLRTVWPARFRAKSDEELAGLVKNGIALGDAVYGGRMGNTAPGDGYAYRGGGFLQTTGREAVAGYAKALGLTPSPALLDDCAVTLRFAALEWKEANCCTWADQNDLVAVSKAINTGSATSKVRPVGMKDREVWFAKAWAIWGEKGRPDVPAPPPRTVAQSAMKVAAPVVAAAEVVRQIGPAIPEVPKVIGDTVANVGAWKAAGESVLSALPNRGVLLPLMAALMTYAVVLGVSKLVKR